MDYDDSDASWVQAAGDRQQAARVSVRFSTKPRQDEAATLREGRPIFASVEYVRIQTPGDKLNIIERPVTQADKQRFAREYAGWKAQGEAVMPAGTPLAEWAAGQLTTSTVEELKMYGCYTVEQLAEMSDSNLKNVGIYMQKRQSARDWLERSRSGAGERQMEALNQRLQSQVAALQAQIDAMAANGIAKVEVAPPKRKPGRPKKSPEAPEA